MNLVFSYHALIPANASQEGLYEDWSCEGRANENGTLVLLVIMTRTTLGGLRRRVSGCGVYEFRYTVFFE